MRVDPLIVLDLRLCRTGVHNVTSAEMPATLDGAASMGVCGTAVMDQVLFRWQARCGGYVRRANGVPGVVTGVANIESVPGLLIVAEDPQAFLEMVSDRPVAGWSPCGRLEGFSPGKVSA